MSRRAAGSCVKRHPEATTRRATSTSRRSRIVAPCLTEVHTQSSMCPIMHACIPESAQLCIRVEHTSLDVPDLYMCFWYGHLHRSYSFRFRSSHESSGSPGKGAKTTNVYLSVCVTCVRIMLDSSRECVCSRIRASITSSAFVLAYFLIGHPSSHTFLGVPTDNT